MTMTKPTTATALITGAMALATAALLSPAGALEQVQLGQWYTIHTVPMGTCPALDWHYVVDAHRSIAGYLTRDRVDQIAVLAGTLNADDSFQMTATEAEGNRQALVAGQITSRVITMSVDGAGTVCDKQVFKIKVVRAPGSGGGGG
jgi:hypothetical protein